MVVVGVGPGAGAVVGAAAIGEADLQAELVLPQVPAVAARLAGVAPDGQVEVEPGRVHEQPVD
jgi:hypothetical protein